MKNSSMFRKGVVDSVPIVISFLFVFSGVGALYKEHGINLLDTMLASAMIFAAPLQVSALKALENHELTAALALTVMVNFRFFMMSIVMSQYFKGVGKAKVLAGMIMLSASTYTVSHSTLKAADISDGKSQFSYYLGVAWPSYLVAILATLLGYMLASYMDYSSVAGIVVMILPIHFTALTAKQSANPLAVASTFLGGFCAPALQEISSEWATIVVALIAGAAMALLQEHRTSVARIMK